MAKILSQKKFDLEIEAIRLLIEAEARPFPADKKAQDKRIERASKDMDFFGRTYFPHYITAPSSAFHKIHLRAVSGHDPSCYRDRRRRQAG